MVFTLGNLIVLGLVLAIQFLFRQLDKNNRSLEKLRKYGDHLKGDLGSFVAAHEQGIKDFSIELGVQEQAARELLNRLKTVDEALSSKADTISSIGSRLNEYDAHLEKLGELTTKTKTDIAEIKKNAAFTETLARRIKDGQEQLTQVEREIRAIEEGFAQKNTATLEALGRQLTEDIEGRIEDVQSIALALEDKFEDSKAKLSASAKEYDDKIQANHNIAENILSQAIEQARERASEQAARAEEESFASLSAKANERLSSFQTALDLKIGEYQEISKTRLLEVQQNLKAEREAWQADIDEYAKKLGAQRNDAETALENYRQRAQAMLEQIQAKAEPIAENLEKEIQLLQEQFRRSETSILERAGGLESSIENVEGEFRRQIDRAGKAVQQLAGELSDRVDNFNRDYLQRLEQAISQAEMQGLSAIDSRLNTYIDAANERFERIEGFDTEIENLEEILKVSLGQTEQRIQHSFETFVQTSAQNFTAEAGRQADKFNTLRAQIGNLEAEIEALKEKAYENVSEKLRIFEDDFFADIKTRSSNIDGELQSWKDGLAKRLEELGSHSDQGLENLKNNFAQTMDAHISAMQKRLLEGLNSIEKRSQAIQASANGEVEVLKANLDTWHQDIKGLLEEEKNKSDTHIKVELASHRQEIADLIKDDERNIQEKLAQFTGSIQEQKDEIDALLERQTKDMDSLKERLAAHATAVGEELEEQLEKIRSTRRLVDENALRIDKDMDSQRAEIAEKNALQHSLLMDKYIKLDEALNESSKKLAEFVEKTALFTRTDTLQADLERSIKDLQSNIDRLGQYREEAGQLEAKFTKIKKLEEEVNQKMTRFLAEKRRIEVMEGDFEMLLKTAQTVDSKLAQVTNSNDTIQSLQAQLRRLEDAIGDADAKYQRIEKKNDILQSTAQGIDQHFEALQAAEEQAKNLAQLFADLDQRHRAVSERIAILAKEKDSADAVVEKLSSLDSTLEDLDGRIERMQVARKWLADTETRLGQISQQAQEQVKIMQALFKNKRKDATGSGDGAPPIGVRENVLGLRKQAWDIKDIAKAMDLSVGEVELIIEYEAGR